MTRRDDKAPLFDPPVEYGNGLPRQQYSQTEVMYSPQRYEVVDGGHTQPPAYDEVYETSSPSQYAATNSSVPPRHLQSTIPALHSVSHEYRIPMGEVNSAGSGRSERSAPHAEESYLASALSQINSYCNSLPTTGFKMERQTSPRLVDTESGSPLSPVISTRSGGPQPKMDYKQTRKDLEKQAKMLRKLEKWHKKEEKLHKKGEKNIEKGDKNGEKILRREEKMRNRIVELEVRVDREFERRRL